MKPFVIAIDGPAASGKGTIARNLARHFDWPYLDTGLVYRAVAKNLVKKQLDQNPLNAVREAKDLSIEDLQQEGLRAPEISQIASVVASIPEVRETLIKFQRNFVRKGEGTILDGRDIGTVICPDADIKFFVTASQEVRANRRYQELMGQGERVTYQEVFDTLVERDLRDSTRKNAPLIQSEEAILIDTSDLSAKQSTELVIAKVELGLRDT
ncbi:MAG: (d)CMP kinase [Rhodobacteraceae bacterium]|nr:(d)CMP kinase [Paracoccaceae bacterium]